MKVTSQGLKNAFDPSDVVFYILDKKANYVKEVNGQLRIDDLTKAIQMHLNLISAKLGMRSNYYAFEDPTIAKTAAEIISENNALFDTEKSY